MTKSRICPICQTEFFKKVSNKRWNSNQGKYCSRKCFSSSLIGKSFYRPPRIQWPTENRTLDNGSVIHWSSGFRDDKSYYHVPVTCGICHKTRTILASHTRRKTWKFSGLCYECNLAYHRNTFNHGKDHPAWRGGVFVNGGYRYVQLANLSGEEFEIAQPMARKVHKHSSLVAEHRLVMALHLGTSLKPSEVVHHKNGNKLDNRIENLELTTHANHRKLDVKYYQLWQEALLEIKILKSKL